MAKKIVDTGSRVRKIDPEWVAKELGAEEIKGLKVGHGVVEKLASRELMMKHIEKGKKNKPRE